MKKILTLLGSFTSLFAIFTSPTYAMCPVCTLAVGAGLGLSRYLGIDDAVTGIWAGGLVISVSFWFANWLKKKNFKFLSRIKEPYLIMLSLVLWSALTYIPLWKTGIIGHPFNTIWGIDKLVFGSVLGALVFILAAYLDRKVRKVRGKQLFNYQKVVFPVSFLVISSLLMYFYGGYLK